MKEHQYPADERRFEIRKVELESARRADMQMGDSPNAEPYMDSYATFLLAHATSLIALELNHLNSTIQLLIPSDPFA